MKNSIITTTLLICSLFFTNIVRSTTLGKIKYDSTSCLVVEGKILNSDRGLDGECKIELICYNSVMDSLMLKEGKKRFKFVLSKDLYYAIRISKKGYITKLISVDTKMLTELNGIYKFEFDTELLTEEIAERLNKDILDFPTAIIHFDYDKECFSYNKEYTSYIKRELYNVKPAGTPASRSQTLPQLSGKPLASASH